MKTLPLSFPLEGAPVVLIGEGPRLAQKLTLLQSAGAAVSVHAPPSYPSAEELAAAKFVVVASDMTEVQNAGAALARQAGKLVNVVDAPALSDFHFPAIVDRGDLVISLATGGTAPVLARLWRARLEAAFPPSEAEVARLAAALKAPARQLYPQTEDRRRALEAALLGPASDLARAGRFDEALATAIAALKGDYTQGSVHFVDVGPGDPGRVTLQALQLLSQADLIVHPADLDARILDLCRRDAERRIVADDARADLIAAAKSGRRVIRLMAQNAEIDAVQAAGLAVFIAPGVSGDKARQST